VKVLVTGATGFIGGSLASRFGEAGWQVDVLVRPASLKKLQVQPSGKLIHADLGGDLTDLGKHLGIYDVVYHAAAIRDRWGVSPADYHRVNVNGTIRLLHACQGRARRFIYISTVGVYGGLQARGIDENYPVNPQMSKGLYHKSKALAEQITRQQAPAVEVVIARPTITYGPGDYDGMITRMIRLIKRGQFVRVGRGHNHLDLVYIDDLVEGLRLAGTCPGRELRAFNMSGPSSVSFSSVVEEIERGIGRKHQKFYIPQPAALTAGYLVEGLYRVGAAVGLQAFQSTPIITPAKVDIVCRDRSYSSERARRELGYKPAVCLREGIKHTLEWMYASGLIGGGEGRDLSFSSSDK
jgi:nucleoside-diphosphate-sugar epimerase